MIELLNMTGCQHCDFEIQYVPEEQYTEKCSRCDTTKEELIKLRKVFEKNHYKYSLY